jgi:hypothetical protein
VTLWVRVAISLIALLPAVSAAQVEIASDDARLLGLRAAGNDKSWGGRVTALAATDGTTEIGEARLSG